jgi:hypothetical protein
VGWFRGSAGELSHAIGTATEAGEARLGAACDVEASAPPALYREKVTCAWACPPRVPRCLFATRQSRLAAPYLCTVPMCTTCPFPDLAPPPPTPLHQVDPSFRDHQVELADSAVVAFLITSDGPSGVEESKGEDAYPDAADASLGGDAAFADISAEVEEALKGGQQSVSGVANPSGLSGAGVGDGEPVVASSAPTLDTAPGQSLEWPPLDGAALGFKPVTVVEAFSAAQAGEQLLPESAAPSAAVSAVPSAAVSAVPSAAVSAVPSAAVSAVPSAAVSAVPSAAVSAAPPAVVSATPPVVPPTPTAGVGAGAGSACDGSYARESAAAGSGLPVSPPGAVLDEGLMSVEDACRSVPLNKAHVTVEYVLAAEAKQKKLIGSSSLKLHRREGASSVLVCKADWEQVWARTPWGFAARFGCSLSA